MRLRRLHTALVVALALVSQSAWALDRYTVPVVCGTDAELTAILERYGERAMMIMSSERQLGSDAWQFSAVFFANPSTGTWTLIEQIQDDLYCAVASGTDLAPQVSKTGI